MHFVSRFELFSINLELFKIQCFLLDFSLFS